MVRWKHGGTVLEQIGDMARQMAIQNMVVEDAVDERAAPRDLTPEEEDMVNRVDPTRRRIRPVVKSVDPKAIYVWTFESSRAVGGQKTFYATELFEDGTVKCNCPGWVYKRKDALGCKHTNQILHEIPTILQMYRDGDDLPLQPAEEVKSGFLVNASGKRKAKKEATEPNRFGRKIQT